MANNNDFQQLLKQYKSSVVSSFIDQFSKEAEINEKYQLTPGTETDFNNCAKFLAYSIVKNSEKIDAAETEFSSVFGKALKKYYNTYLTDLDINELGNYIYAYNKKIDEIYDINADPYILTTDKVIVPNKNYYTKSGDTYTLVGSPTNENIGTYYQEHTISKENIQRIMTNIYGIDYNTMQIKADSYAEKLNRKISVNYIGYILKEKQEELNRLAKDYLIQTMGFVSPEYGVGPGGTYKDNTVTADQAVTLANMNDIMLKTYLSYYKLVPIYLNTRNPQQYKYFAILFDGSKSLINQMSVCCIKNDAALEEFYTALCYNTLSDYFILAGDDAKNMPLIISDETNQYHLNMIVDDGNQYVLTEVGQFIEGLNSTPASSVATNNGIQNSFNFLTNLGQDTGDYMFDQYEQTFLRMVTYDYILTRISKKNGLMINKGAFEVDNSAQTENAQAMDYISYNFNMDISKNNDNSEILYSGKAFGIDKTVVSNSYDLLLTIFSNDIDVSMKVNIGSLNDPYFSKVNQSTTIVDDAQLSCYYMDHGVEVNDVTANIESLTKDTFQIKYDALNFNANTHKFFIEENSNSAYYTLDIKAIYEKYSHLQRIKVNNDLIYDRSDNKYYYENEIKDLYYKYFFPCDIEAENAGVSGSIVNVNEYKSELYKILTGDEYTVEHKADDLFIQKVDEDDSYNYTYKIMKNVYKVYYEFTKSQNFDSNTSLDQYYAKEKRNSDSLETYYALQYYNVNYMTLNNLVVDHSSDLYQTLSKLYDLSGNDAASKSEYGFNDNTKNIISINILYKELNPEIRLIDYSDIQNNLLARYVSDMDGAAISSNIYDILYQYTVDEDSKEYIHKYLSEIPSNERKLFLSLRTNSYIIRNSVVDDIVAYIQGEILGYGRKASELQEIEEIKKLYKETRDYFYAVLLNKAFILDDLYSVYKQLYIKAYTIERFISSRIDNVHTIDKYNDTDCRNFLISYGLKTLSDQVDNNNFTDSLTYKKRIIANYNNLMSQKGSRAIMDEFFKIFNYDTTEIEVYKYMLLKMPKDTSNASLIGSPDNINLNFLPIPYAATNIASAIQKYSNKAKPYSDFITKDKYWSADDLSEEQVKSVLESPINTKYMGIDLKKDIYMSYIKTKYALSLNDYLYDKLYIDTENKYYDKLTVESNIFGDEISVIMLYHLAKVLFSSYIYLSDILYTNGSVHSIVDVSYGQRFYGINRNTQIGGTNGTDFDFYSNTFLTESLLTELFKCQYAKYNPSNNNSYQITDKTDYIDFYNVTNLFTPYTYNSALSSTSSTDGNTIIFGAKVTNVQYGNILPYIIPVNLNLSDSNLKNAIDTSFYNIFVNNTYDVIKDRESTSKTSVNLTSYSALNRALSSITLINFINKNYSETNNAIDDEYLKKLKAIYYHYKIGNSESNYPSNPTAVNTYDQDFNLFNNNFYGLFYERILDYPFQYLDGRYGNHADMKYDIDTRNILNEIFNKFYTVDVDAGDPIGYLSGNINTDTTFLRKEITGVDPDFLSKYSSQLSEILSPLVTIETSGSTLTLSFAHTDDHTLDQIAESELPAAITTISENLITVLAELTNAISAYDYMKLDIQFSESLSNLFDFIKTCIEFFISYTANLYESNLIYKIDTQNERFPITYSINDYISHSLTEYAYYDEDISIDEVEAIQNE